MSEITDDAKAQEHGTTAESIKQVPPFQEDELPERVRTRPCESITHPLRSLGLLAEASLTAETISDEEEDGIRLVFRAKPARSENTLSTPRYQTPIMNLFTSTQIQSSSADATQMIMQLQVNESDFEDAIATVTSVLSHEEILLRPFALHQGFDARAIPGASERLSFDNDGCLSPAESGITTLEILTDLADIANITNISEDLKDVFPPRPDQEPAKTPRFGINEDKPSLIEQVSDDERSIASRHSSGKAQKLGIVRQYNATQEGDDMLDCTYLDLSGTASDLYHMSDASSDDESFVHEKTVELDRSPQLRQEARDYFRVIGQQEPSDQDVSVVKSLHEVTESSESTTSMDPLIPDDRRRYHAVPTTSNSLGSSVLEIEYSEPELSNKPSIPIRTGCRCPFGCRRFRWDPQNPKDNGFVEDEENDKESDLDEPGFRSSYCVVS